MATILIVDDRPVSRQPLVTLLGKAGHRLLEAGSGDEGLVIARAERPDLIVADIVMPTMDGYDFARLARADPVLSQTQIVFCTPSYVVAETRRLAEACGVAHIIGQPAEPEDILQTIDLALHSQPADAWRPVSEAFHQEHMRLLTDQLAAKVAELESEMVRRQRTEQALRASEAELRALFAAMTDVILVLDADGRYLKIAPTNPRFLVAPSRELIGRTVHEIFQPDQADFFVEHIRQALGTSQPGAAEYSLAVAGATYWFEAAVSPLGANSVLWIARDITARKQAEQAVRQSEQRYRLLFTSNPLPMWVYDLETLRFLAVNDSAVERYGYSRDEFLALTIRDIRPAEDLPRLEANLAASREPHERSGAWRHRKKDGTVIEVEIVSNEFDFDGRAARLVSANDVTERRRAEAEVLRQLDRLAGLRAIDLAISASLDLQVTLPVVLDQVISQLQADAADIFLLRPDSNTLEYAAGRGLRSPAAPDVRLQLGQPYAGRVALERRTLSVPDLARQGAGAVRIPSFETEGFRAYFAVPLISKGQVTGVLEVYQRAPLYPDGNWLDFLEALAGQAAIAIDNARLFDGLQRSNQDLSQAYNATIEGWSRVLDLRDRETEGHSQRVTELTLRLAQRLGMGDEELGHMRWGALLHDIGKMGVPDSILLKPGPLTDDEWVIMRQHPLVAYDMLSPIQYLRPALDIPHCHHEKWDGTGYPRQLRGAAIPLAARIFAVVDVWDALRSDRPYRAAWSEAKAREHIRSQAGLHFDPKVEAAFEQLIAEK